MNSHIHAIVVELLQVIISRGEIDIVSLQSVESALISRLFLAIHRSELDLQNKVLHVLHSVICAISQHHSKRSLELTIEATDSLMDSSARDVMFVRILSDAISIQHNSAVVHHWIDFLLMTIPHFVKALHNIIFPLIECLVLRLRSLVDEFQSAYAPDSKVQASDATEAEFVVLVNALERLVLVAATEAKLANAEEEPRSPEQRAMGDGSSAPSSGLLGYMSGVLGSAESEPVGLGDYSKVSLSHLAI